MKKLSVTVLFFLVLGVIIASCTTTPIEQQYPERWEKTYIGMPLEEFKQVWPEAIYDPDKTNETTALYYVLDSTHYGKFEFEFFTFENDILVKYEAQSGLGSL